MLCDRDWEWRLSAWSWNSSTVSKVNCPEAAFPYYMASWATACNVQCGRNLLISVSKHAQECAPVVTLVWTVLGSSRITLHAKWSNLWDHREGHKCEPQKSLQLCDFCPKGESWAWSYLLTCAMCLIILCRPMVMCSVMIINNILN